ncbi:MAG: TIGR04290 family methyltransferase [Myxococcales bacterium]
MRSLPGMGLNAEQIQARVRELGPWFHDLDLNGVRTAPDHFLGSYPLGLWSCIEHAVPRDLTGKSVIDIGCNAGFFSIEMSRRGAARVLAVDHDERYLEQARLAVEVAGARNVELRKMSVYDIAEVGEKFDLVVFMGVFYHLRHPLLALDLVREHVASDLMLFECMLRGSPELKAFEPDYPFEVRQPFDDPAWPRMHFIEKKYAHDPTNWWTPNRAGMEAMLRSSGFEIVQHASAEVWLCRVAGRPQGEGAVYPNRGSK